MRKLTKAAALHSLGVAVALATLGAASPSFAQTYPTKPVTIIVPFPPAGGADTLARILAVQLGRAWKQSVLVDNRPGASGHIGANYVARAPGDGYTLIMSSTAALTKENADKFAPIALVSASPYIVAANPKLGVKNIRELVAKAKAEPNKITFGSSGDGSGSHLTAELFNQVAGVELMHVPYKGTGQAVNDLLAGTIDLMFAPSQTVSPHVKSGKLVALAATGEKRSKATPELPTIAEAGVPNYAAVGWFGLLAPASTPKALVEKLGADVNRALSDAAVEKSMLEAGAEPARGTPASFGKFIHDELNKWEALEARTAKNKGGKS